ncbi:hypothetical protein [Brevundimonas sp. NIBR11]|uniref:hypothetical protein n=1 Tax=Brevundimonas sp. NIBR11 TaxID=3015999 RepID=UPI0022EFF140|nr:hypothetical protein [Brevundimonas sp. NIBR11]WGM32195.1 hypothetical protein KKHFBJBL_02446 [Brevundimonas sp. NIBR11]
MLSGRLSDVAGVALYGSHLPSSAESQTRNPASQTAATRRPGRRWLTGAAVSLGVHLAGLLAFLTVAPAPTIFSAEPPPEPVIVSLAPPPPPLPVAEPDPPPGPAEPSQAAEPPAPASLAPTPPRPRPPAAPRPPRPAPPEVEPLPVAAAPPGPAPATPPAGLTLAQLAGAATAGSGSGGGGAGAAGGGGGPGSGAGRCDMIRRVQNALRGNAGVVASAARAQSALPASHRALLVWDGDWVMNPGEAGRGLAGLRQAIAVAVAFAPAECRRQSVRGLVLLTLEDDADGPRLALGQGAWRWSDLTGAG